MSDVSILIIVLLLIAVLLRIDFIFYLIYVVAGIYVWSRWNTGRALDHVRLDRSYTDHAFLGERITVRVTLHNKSLLPISWLQVSESVPPELAPGHNPGLALSLRGRETASFTYDIQPSRRGYYRLGPLHMRTGDLFGWSEVAGTWPPTFVTVYPRIIPLTKLGLPSRLPFGTIAGRQRLFEDPARPTGVRDYRSGDSLRQINWKVSAHHERLLVRTLQPAKSLDTAILLNLDLNDYERRTRYRGPEWAIVVAASLAAHLARRQQAVGLATNGHDPLLQSEGRLADGAAFDDTSGRLSISETMAAPGGDGLAPVPIPPRGGRVHLMKILELLARIEPVKTTPFLDWVPRACLHLSWGVTVPTITPAAGEATCQALHQLVRAGLNPVLIVVTPTAGFGDVRERARRLGFTAYHITKEKDLDMWREPVVRRPG